MFRFVPYVFKTLWRHRTRTLLTVSGSAVAILVMSFVISIQQGLQRLIVNDDAQGTLIVFQENRFCPTSSRLPEDYRRRVQELPGVAGVMPVQVWTNNCRASLDVVVVHGVPAETLQSRRPIRVEQGDWSAFANRRDAALVGRQFAQRRNVNPGDQLTFGEISVHVAGIFTSRFAAEEDVIYSHLEFLQLTAGQSMSGLVTQLEVQLDSGADPQVVAREIDAALRSGPVATTTRSKGAFQAGTLSDLIDLIGFAHWLGIACVGLVLSLVATTTVMSVQDRIREHAVLQTLGVRPGRLMRIVLSEGVVVCLLGGVLGASAAWLILTWSNFSIGAEGVSIAMRPSWEILTLGLVSVVVGAIASLIPAFLASRAAIVPSLQQA